MPFLYVGAGAVLGALSRFSVSLLLGGSSPRFLPLATLLVNVLGSFAIGAFVAWTRANPSASDALRLFVVVGFLGSFTTYSAFSLETLGYLDAGQAGRALALVAAHLTLGLGAVWLGMRSFA